MFRNSKSPCRAMYHPSMYVVVVDRAIFLKVTSVIFTKKKKSYCAFCVCKKYLWFVSRYKFCNGMFCSVMNCGADTKCKLFAASVNISYGVAHVVYGSRALQYVNANLYNLFSNVFGHRCFFLFCFFLPVLPVQIFLSLKKKKKEGPCYGRWGNSLNGLITAGCSSNWLWVRNPSKLWKRWKSGAVV